MPQIKQAYAQGWGDALAKFGAEEIRLKIPRREFHGRDGAFKAVADRHKQVKKADNGATPLEPQAHPSDSVEQLTALLQGMNTHPEKADESIDPTDTAPLWSSARPLSDDSASTSGQGAMSGKAF